MVCTCLEQDSLFMQCFFYVTEHTRKEYQFMAWIYLLIASVFEVGFALSARASEGFTRFWPTVSVFIVGTAGTYFLSLALRTLPLGTTYAIWTGIGVMATTLIGIFFFNESVNLWRILCILLILVGIVGLRLITPTPAD
jgi:quaternary ammonium compound-resistance protein SugE